MAKVHTGADVKSQFKPLSEADIQASTDDPSFQKGHDYYLHHTIVEPTLSESVLRAYCHGSSGSPYRDGRGRDNYQQATDFLLRVRLLYQQQEQEPEWHAYITNLRNSNKSLRALKEELDKRNL